MLQNKVDSICVRRNKQQDKYDETVKELNTKIEAEGEAKIDQAIAKFNQGLQQWQNKQRQFFVQSVAIHVLKNTEGDLLEKVGVTDLQKQIEEEQAKVNALRDVVRKRVVEYVKKDWEDDTEYPAELREAILNGLKEGKGFYGLGSGGYGKSFLSS